MKYTTVFLDLDDTLIDTAQNTMETVKEIYKEYDLGRYFDSSDDFFLNAFQPNNIRLWHEYEQNKISKDDLIRNRFIGAFESVEEISEKYALEINTDYLQRIVKKNTLIPGTKEVLDYLKPKYQIVIISNGFTEMQYDKIENAGINGYFDKIVLSDKVGINKPQGGIFDFALKEANVSPDCAIMIGDNYLTDITGARSVGIDQIWYNPKDMDITEFEPTHNIRLLNEIVSIL